MIIAIVGQKGGVGKTTIAFNFAINGIYENIKTLLVDTDPQSSSAQCLTWRKETLKGKLSEGSPNPPKLYQLKGDVYDPLLDQSGVYPLIIVDTGGVDSIEMRSAVLAADIVVCPVRPGNMDIDTLGKMNQIIEHARASGNRDLKAIVVLTHTPTNPCMADEREAREILDQLPSFKPARTSLKYRSAYWRTTNVGLSVMEGDNSKAKGEMSCLIKEVINEG